MDGEVLIVDEHTGRMLAGRRYNDGLHQAIEAKEGVQVREENQTLATDHPAELLPPLRQARRHDRYGDDRGRGVRQDLQARRRPDPDQQADAAHGPARPRLPHRGGEVRRRRRRHRRAAPQGPAGPGRHRVGREVRAPLQPAHASAASRTRCSTPSSTPTRRRSSPWPVTRVRSPSPPTWPVAAPTSCSAAPSSSSPTRSCASRGSTRRRPRRSTKRPGPSTVERDQGAGRPPSTTRCARSAASTSSAPSATSRAASTTSCAVAPAVRATRASPGSTSRCRTT